MIRVATLPTLPHVYTAGDTIPNISGFIESTDIAGYTITLYLEQPDATVIERAAVITSEDNGLFEFTWLAGDLLEGAGQRAEIRFVDQTGAVQTSKKFLIDVDEALA